MFRMRTVSSGKTENGNILFLILLAVVLFAALSAAITASFRNGNPDGMSKEAANAAAADIDSWFASLDLGVQRMMLMNGVTANMLDVTDPENYNYNGTIRTSDNQSCTTSACEIFNPAGGGVISRTFSKYGVTLASNYTPGWVAAGNKEYTVVNIQDLGTSLNEVAVVVNYVKLDICKAYNRLQNLPECPSASGTGSVAYFWGGADVAATNLASGSARSITGSDIKGKASFCICNLVSNLGNITHAFLIQ